MNKIINSKPNNPIGDSAMDSFRCSINDKIINKDIDALRRRNSNFQETELNISELLEEGINQGKAFSPIVFKDNTRTGENFTSTQLLVLDFDKSNLEETLGHEYIKSHASAYYTTPSHRVDGNGDKFRIIFQLPEPIIDREMYKSCMVNLLEKFPEADQACKDTARVFYGSKNCTYGYWDRKISLEEFENLKTPKSTREKSAKVLSPLSPVINKTLFNEIKDMLIKFIPNLTEYEEWRNIVWSLCSRFQPEEVRELVNSWSPDRKNDGKQLEELISRYDGSISIGTLYYYAKKHGCDLPKHYLKKLTAGLAVEEELIKRKNRIIISASSLLHEYKNGYYEPIKDADFNKEVSNFFKSYITNFETGATNYAKPCCTEEAYKYLVQSYAIDTDKINPSGINLKNGFLRLSYDESSKPVFTLEKHSPEQLNIYICDYEYNPAADDLELNTFLDNVLGKADQEIILRLVASCLDIKTARKRAGRGLRAVINYGDGANGKDTLREIFTQLIGKHRFTSISLQNFKEADSGRRFGIFDLYRSAINWSSENSAINLDKSQTLKAAITGDPIQLERKNKDPIETNPRAIFFFNMNGMPNISSLGEAVKSRLCPIEFKNTFKTNPNPSISTEKKADPRFKEDPEFIRKNILPALLNRIIDAFSKLLDEGIGYSSKEKHFEDIARSNNHLLEFIEESSLVECSSSEGLNVSEVYKFYVQWCLSSGLANDKSEISKSAFISDSDKFISTPAEISKKLGECLPNIKRGRVKRDGKSTRVIGLKRA
ncbi:MAG: hypothetical protein KGO93_03340 [Cyanobacteria bacterium REEB446]|nr:hypothetical protein [Cyanobacteria bacterium REEB446]